MSSQTKREAVKNFRYKKNRGNDNEEEEELLVFGYASRLYESDEKAEWIAEERHLIRWPGEQRLLIDRYDCRLYLGSLDELGDREATAENGGDSTAAADEECPTEALEEEMCEEERYRDLHEHMQRIQEEEEMRRRAEVEFNYEAENAKAESSSSEEEIDEPFRPPDGIKLPLGINLPETMKLNAVMERTASFVVAQGPQMEIVIKAKQRGNVDQFGFLEFDHPLNAYYKYISKMIREKKYTPKPHIPQRRPKPKKLRRLQEEEERMKREEEERKNNASEIAGISPCRSSSNALTAIAEEDTSDSDDENSDAEGHYLHPLLMGGAARKTTAGSESPVIGPKTREEHQRSETPSASPPRFKVDYELGKGNDMYSSLFKSLSELVQQKPTQAGSEANDDDSKKEEEELAQKDDYAEWYLSFYGEVPASATQPAVLPPPPDLTTPLNTAAEYVAKYGCRAEYLLASRDDLGMEFTKSSSPYYSYYQARVRYYQWMHAVAAHEAAMQEASTSAEKAENSTGEEEKESLCSDADVTEELEREDEGDEPVKVEAESAEEGGLTTTAEAAEEDDDDIPLSSLVESVLQAPPPPAPTVYMNRRMRRRGFHDPPSSADLTSTCATEIGLVEPVVQLPKTQSMPTLSAEADEGTESPPAANDVKKPTVAPISFSLTLSKSDDQLPLSASAVALGAYDDEEDLGDSSAKALDVPAGVVTNIAAPGVGIPPPPVAPVPLASGQLALEGSAELQLERKEKARLFMEKILNEKRAAKLKAQNAELHNKDGEITKEAATKALTERRSNSAFPAAPKPSMASGSKEAGRGQTAESAEGAVSPSEIDKLISSQMEALLNASSRHKKDRSKREHGHHSSEKKKKKKKKKSRGTEEEGEIKSDEEDHKKKRRKLKDRSVSRSPSEEHRRPPKKKRKRHSSNESDARNRRSRSHSRRHRR